MTLVVMAVLLGGATVLQLVLPAFAVLAQAKPPLVLAVVMYYALNRDERWTLAAAFFGGVLLDLLDPMPPGVSSFIFCVLGFAVARLRRVMLSQSLGAAAVFTFACGIAATLGAYVLLARGGRLWWPVGRVVWRAIATGLLGGVCGPAVYAAARGLDRLVGNIEYREVLNGIEQPLA